MSSTGSLHMAVCPIKPICPAGEEPMSKNGRKSMKRRWAFICIITLVGAAVLSGLPSAQALTMKECGAKYKAAQQAGTLQGMKWNDFRKTECGSNVSETSAA